MEDPLKHPKAELTSAENALNRMKNSKTFEEFEEHWKSYLSHIEKAWTKTERCCVELKDKFQPYQGGYKNLRKRDELLRYLKQARDADNHSIQDLSQLKPASWSIQSMNPGGAHFIKSMRVENGVLKHYEGDPMKVTFNPATIKAKRVKNNGVWFNPPTSHNDQKLRSKHPTEMAELGLKFYKEFVSEVESKFFN